MRSTQKEFDKMFEYVREDILSETPDKEKEAAVAAFIERSLKDDQTGFLRLLFRKMARIDKKIDVDIEVAEMYSFATVYCLAKKFNLTKKELNALYDEVEREAKNILERTVEAKEESRRISDMISVKYKKGKAK